MFGARQLMPETENEDGKCIAHAAGDSVLLKLLTGLQNTLQAEMHVQVSAFTQLFCHPRISLPWFCLPCAHAHGSERQLQTRKQRGGGLGDPATLRRHVM
jgi:hypothetical protein